MNTNDCRFTGNLAADPEYGRTEGGATRVRFRIGVTKQVRNRQTQQWEDGPTTWIRCVAWGRLADNIAATFTRGMRVTVSGDLQQSSYTDRNGVDRTSYELNVAQAGPDLTFATATVSRNDRTADPEPEF